MIDQFREDEGVTVVVGAILITGIILGAIVMVRISYVPVWEQEAEAAHMQEVSRAMTEMAADVNRRLDNRSTAPLVSPVPMIASGGTNPFSSQRFSGTLSFDPGGSPVQIQSPSFLEQVRNGEEFLGTSEEWDSVGSQNEITDVSTVASLRLNLTGPPCQSSVTSCFDQGDHVRATIQDANGDFAGDLTAFIDHGPQGSSTSFIKVKVRAPTDPPRVVFNNSVLSFQQTDWDPPYWVNTLNNDYRFNNLLNAAEKPLDIILTEEGLNGEFSAVYRQVVASSGGTVIVGGGGNEIEDYSQTITSGRLSFESNNNFYLQQSYIIENGALILNQSDGAVFDVTPPLDLTGSSQAIIVDLGIPALRGDASTLSGGHTASVRLATSSASSLEAAAGQLTLSFFTDYPSLWRTFIEDELEAAGITQGPNPSAQCPPSNPGSQCQYQLSTDGRRVDLTLYGPTPYETDPRDPDVRDISIRLSQGRITTEVRQ